jgi:hypothetical protein
MFVSCKSYKIKNVYFKSETLNVDTRIIRIDSTENDYVYFLKNDTMNAFFTKSIQCKQVFKSIIDTAKNYQLIIKTDANNNYLSKTYSEVYYHEGIDTTFNYRDYRLILLDSPDICGQTVNCKENPEFKKEFFSNIKTIDSLIYRTQNQQFNKSLEFISKYSHVTFESKANYTGRYPVGVYEQDRKIWIDWYEKNKCTNIQFKE